MNAREIGGDGRTQRRDSGFGDVGERGPGLVAVDQAAQQLHPDLKPALVGPAPQQVERVLEPARSREHRAEIRGEPVAVRAGGRELGRQHRVEQCRTMRQALREQRRLGHDLGDQRQQAGIGVEQREQLHPGRQL